MEKPLEINLEKIFSFLSQVDVDDELEIFIINEYTDISELLLLKEL